MVCLLVLMKEATMDEITAALLVCTLVTQMVVKLVDELGV